MNKQCGNNIENSMLTGPPEHDGPGDPDEIRYWASRGCLAEDEAGDCQLDGKFCREHEHCPDGRW